MAAFTRVSLRGTCFVLFTTLASAAGVKETAAVMKEGIAPVVFKAEVEDAGDRGLAVPALTDGLNDGGGEEAESVAAVLVVSGAVSVTRLTALPAELVPALSDGASSPRRFTGGGGAFFRAGVAE